MRAVVLLLMLGGASATPYSDRADLVRARAKAPARRVVGKGHVGMAKKLNAALRKMRGMSVKPCEEFGVGGLVELQRKLHDARDPALEEIYRAADDAGRRMGVSGSFASERHELEALWAKELSALNAYPQLVNATRDAKCHEAVMWLVHHVPQKAQKELRKELTIPLLPERERHMPASVPKDVTGPPPSLGCEEAHAEQTKANNNEYVEWPEELTYTALGRGPLPFWDNTGPGCTYCDKSLSGSAVLKVRYSAKRKAEILMHAKCGDMTWTGGANAPKSGPCNHIFTATDGAFIYVPETALEPAAKKETGFCCRTVAAGSKVFTGSVPRDWMKTAKYAGTHDGFKGEYYSGTIKMFTWSDAFPLEFWYYTQSDGTPVQQGESCNQPKGEKPQECSQGPVTLYHDYDASTFTNATFTDADFAVPDICKSTTVACTAPDGGSTRETVIV